MSKITKERVEEIRAGIIPSGRWGGDTPNICSKRDLLSYIDSLTADAGLETACHMVKYPDGELHYFEKAVTADKMCATFAGKSEPLTPLLPATAQINALKGENNRLEDELQTSNDALTITGEEGREVVSCLRFKVDALKGENETQLCRIESLVVDVDHLTEEREELRECIQASIDGLNESLGEWAGVDRVRVPVHLHPIIEARDTWVEVLAKNRRSLGEERR